MRDVVLGHDHGAARLLIEPVHDAGSLLTADAGKICAMMEQRVHQRVLLVARTRVHDEPGGFVDDKEIVVFVENLEWDFLRLRAARGERRLDQPNDIARVDGLARTRRPASPGHGAALDPFLQTRARKLRERLCEEAIEAHAVVRPGDFELDQGAGAAGRAAIHLASSG